MGQGITLEKARKVFSDELGCSFDREELLDIIQANIEFLLHNGGGDILREWTVPIKQGRFTFPRELEVPVKYNFSTDASLGFGTFHSSFYPYSSNSVSRCCGYMDWNELEISIKPNKVATYYNPPPKGGRIVATTRSDVDVGKRIIVQGERCGHPINNPIKSLHNGYKIEGEILTIYKEDDPDKKYSAYVFDTITGVVKDETCDYVMLSVLDDCNNWYFLSHYTPDETVPRYTEGFLHKCSCDPCDLWINILGRVSPSIRYTRDEEILPINSHDMLKMLAQRARYNDSGNFKELEAIEVRIARSIRKQVAYQQAAHRHLSFSLGASGATLTNA